MLKLAFFQTPGGRSPVEDYIAKQDDEARARIHEALDAFCEEFPMVESVSIKPLRDKLWEIRVPDDRARNHRLLYVVVARTLLVVHAFTKKTQKTPPTELKLALRRVRDVTRQGAR